MEWWPLLIAVGVGLLVVWLLLLVTLWLAQRRSADPPTLREALQLLPDVVRLLRALAADRELPRGVRIRLVLLLGYLLSPIDVVPDFIPVLGYADDAIVVVVALRSVVRRAGPTALARHWAGTPAGLSAMHRLAGLPPVA